MNCYDGDTLLCQVKNGKEEICYAANGVIYFGFMRFHIITGRTW